MVAEHEGELGVGTQRGRERRERARQQDVVVVQRLDEAGARANQREVARRRDAEVTGGLDVHALVRAHVRG